MSNENQPQDPGADQEQITSDQASADTAQADASQEAEPEQEYIPIQQYNRLYGKLKERERELESFRNPGGTEARVRVPQAQMAAEPVDETTAYLRKAISPMLEPILEEVRQVRPTVAAIRAERAENAFWSRPENQGYDELREEVSQIYRAAVENGYSTSPELILEALIGRQQRVARAAKREIATETVKRVKRVNEAARTETNASATTVREPADPNEMTLEQLEAALSGQVIYDGRRR